MRKKYLSALLFGALLFASAGTFTSCKDYDDDINGLRTEITDLKSAIDELKTKIGDGKFVTNVASNGQGLTINWNDGSSTTIENVINEATGETEAGDVITFDETTGEILINGEGSGYYAAKNPETGEVKVPYVNNDGALVLINEKGEEVVTNILTAPVTAVTNTDGSVTLTIRANGTTQTVLVPSFASSITAVELLDDEMKPTTVDKTLTIQFWQIANEVKWDGPRGNIPAKSILYSAEDGKADMNFKLSPANVDGTTVEFALVNSNDSYAPLKLTAPANDKTLITRASTYNNGMYQTSVGERSEIFAYTTGYTDFTSQFDAPGSNTDKIMFALTPNITGTDVRSPYMIKVTHGGTPKTSAAITEVWINGVDNTAAAKKYDVAIQSTNDVATIRVGEEASVTVKEAYNMYDMYMEVTDAARDKFGLQIDNEARTIIATQSPDDLTDATFDLNVYVMDNSGKKYNVTTIKVTVNRTMAESAYEQQVKALTKRDDTFSVSATPLFNSLGTQLNDWKESVGLGNTKIELLEMNASGDLVTATETLSNFKGGTSTIVSNNTDLNNGNIAFLNADNKKATAADLANIRFNLNIPQSGSPLKIDKDYYIRLSFYSNETTPVLLNTITVPFKLTKPELSTILVKESGVFRDGDNLAYAYMYWQDAYRDAANKTGLIGDSDGNALSRYYIDRAFTDLYDKLDDAHMTFGTGFTFELETNTKVEGTDKKTDYFAKPISQSTQFGSQARDFIELKVDTDSDGKDDYAGYKKDLIVNFTGHYLSVNDDSYKYTDTYKFRIMSPILEGEAIAANNMVEVSATGRTRIYKEDIWAKTYNNDVKYDIFKKDNAGNWYRDDIKDVTFSTGNRNVFQMTVATPTPTVSKPTEKDFVDSYIEVEGVSENTAKLNVAIEDIWGYTLEDQVDIKTTLNLGE